MPEFLKKSLGIDTQENHPTHQTDHNMWFTMLFSQYLDHIEIS